MTGMQTSYLDKELYERKNGTEMNVDVSLHDLKQQKVQRRAAVNFAVASPGGPTLQRQAANISNRTPEHAPFYEYDSKCGLFARQQFCTHDKRSVTRLKGNIYVQEQIMACCLNNYPNIIEENCADTIQYNTIGT